MRTFFDGAGLIITDEWVQAGDDRFALGEIRRAWTGTPSRTGGHVVGRWTLVLLAAVLVVGVTFWPIVGAWVAAHWWVLAIGVPAFGVLLFWQIGIDLLIRRKEHRPHQLWIDTSVGERSVLTDNEVEVNKALRALDRARSTIEISPTAEA